MRLTFMQPAKGKLLAFVAVTLIMVGVLCIPVKAEDLPPAKSQFLIDFLNNSWIMARTKKGFVVNIYVDQDEGECDGPRYETCPKKRIWIAVSEFSDYPDHNVYPLPAAEDWAFLGWVSRPAQTNDPNSFVIFHLRQSHRVVFDHPAPDGTRFKWADQDYEIRVNPWHAYIEEIKPATKR